MNQESAATPIACQRLSGVFSPEVQKRHAQIWKNIEAKMQGIDEMETGYAFRFPLEAELFQELAEYITYERLCCSFFHFALELEPTLEIVRLHLTGGEGVKDFLTLELESYSGRFE